MTTATTATAAKERPILFSGPMVRALLSGTKTQTRRLVKPQPLSVVDDPESFERYPYSGSGDGTLLCGYDECPPGFRPTRWFTFDATTNATIEFCRPDVGRKPTPSQLRREIERQQRFGSGARWSEAEVLGVCPYGQRHDLLWVRENTAYAEAENGNELRVYQADNAIADVYQLDDGPKSLNGFRDERWDDSRNGRLRYTPSIHMPRWACRLTLCITSVRVERLNDISEEDAIAEGSQIPIAELPKSCRGGCLTERTAFSRIWESVNGKGSWTENPWVWVISFERIL